MYEIQHLKDSIKSVKNIRAVAAKAGISEKTMHRIKTGETDTTFGTANKILAAIKEIYPDTQNAA